MKKTNLKEKLQNWKLGNYFRELSIVTAGVFITLAGTDFINSASQEKQINKSMQMIKMELEENLKSINQAEAAYLNEINFFRLLIQKQDSLQTIKASILENNANAPFAYENCEYSEDALEVLKSSALMQQIPDKEFILKLLQAYKGCRKINEDNKDYYKYKQDHITRYLSHQTSNNIHKNYNSIYEVWAARLQEYDIKQLILTMPNTFNENPFTTPQKVIKETIELINQTLKEKARLSRTGLFQHHYTLKYLQILFSNYFERDLYRNFLVKFNDSFVRTNFFHCIFHNDNLSVNLVTQFFQFLSNLNVANRTENSTCGTHFSSNSQG